MPFKSDAQRRFMYARHPRIAKRWQKETPKGKDLPEKVSKKSAAYAAGVKLALEDAGLLKTAGIDPAMALGAKRLFSSAGEGLKDFFTAKRVREALKNLGQASESGTPKLTEKGQYLLDLPGAVGKTPIQMARQDVLSALKPYGIVAGLGSAAALTPSILRAVYPELGD